MHSTTHIQDLAQHYIDNPALIPRAWRALREGCLSEAAAKKMQQALTFADQALSKAPPVEESKDNIENILRETIRRHTIKAYTVAQMYKILDWPLEIQAWHVKKQVSEARGQKSCNTTLAWREIARTMKLYSDCNLSVETDPKEHRAITATEAGRCIAHRDKLRKEIRAIERQIREQNAMSVAQVGV